MYYDSPLVSAKRHVERQLAASGIPFTILTANFFMEVWLSPALGFDVANRRVVIFGDGRALISWISLHDVAELAVRWELNGDAVERVLEGVVKRAV